DSKQFLHVTVVPTCRAQATFFVTFPEWSNSKTQRYFWRKVETSTSAKI
ncbi:hypothetical protein M514_02929, partial [Trichuris suis]